MATVCCRAVFLLDSYLSWCYFYVYSYGELIIEPPTIKSLYRRNLLKEDLVAGLPYDILVVGLVGSSAKAMRLGRELLRLPKIIRMKRFSGYFEQVATIANKFGVSYFVIRVIELAGNGCL